LGASRGGGKEKASSTNASPNGRPEASSFDQILKAAKDDKPTDNKPAAPSQVSARKSDKDVRVQSLPKDSVPVQRRADDRPPEKSSAGEMISSKNEPGTAQQEKQNWDEPGSVQEKGQSEKVGNKTNSESPNREQVMLEFMDSMESEFGIPPQRIVEAMTKIPKSEQLSSPEDSASQVIAQLNLPDDDEQKALALYLGMLAQLKMAQESPMPKAAMMAAGAATAATAPALVSAQEKRASLNHSLDQMNSKFFMQGPNAMKPGSQAVTKFNSPVPEMPDLDTKPDIFPQDKVAFNPQSQSEKLPSFMRNPEVIQKPDPGLNEMQQQMQNVDPNSKEGQALLKSLATLSASAAALNQGLKSDPKNMQALKAEQVLIDPKAQGTATASAASAAGLAALGFNGGDDDSDDTSSGEHSSPDQQLMTSQLTNPHLSHSQAQGVGGETQFGAMMAAAGAGANHAVSANEKQANIQQLMNQAQYLIKKGGGEAKIQMAPEGIGQVHMKMTVLDGKVNLEMQAETKEAKKLIESSLGDLKTHLAHHQLAMDQVKVDVGNQTSSDAQSQDSKQRQMDPRQEQSKDQTRQFWSEFNGSGGGFERRGGFTDSPGVRAYGGTRRESPLTPTNSGTAQARMLAGSGKGRGLDLVA
jgi:flagellar hook-length control protein FliK